MGASKMSRDDEELKTELAKATAEQRLAQGALISNVKEIFVDPMGAMEKLQSACKHHGKADLLQRLGKNPGALGKMKGMMALNQLKNPLKPNDANRTQEALKSLVDKVDNVLKAEQKVKDLEEALDPSMNIDIKGRGGPSGRG
jgi:hypothetical protein